MSDKKSLLNNAPLPIRAYVALILGILFFSGIFAGQGGAFAWLDFSNLVGSFGDIFAEINFVGTGGFGARHGFLFALSLIPGIMLAMGAVSVAEHLQALLAAKRLLTPLLKPLMGLPGISGLALVTSLQSSDAGAAMTRELYQNNLITEKEKTVFAAFQFSAASSITVYLSMGSALFALISVPHLLPLCVILFYKIVGTNLMRLYLHFFKTEEDVGK